ncbi:MAG: hypothetical protein ACLFO1_00255 [Spirochaetaceae bacterium]
MPPRDARPTRILALVIVLLFVLTAVAPAQQQRRDDPEPYEAEEFPAWLVKLRRFEVVAFGAFPAALLYSNLGYSLYRFIEASIEGGAVTGEEVPVPFGIGGAEALTEEERRGVITVSLSLSGAVALIDLILGFIHDNDEQRPRR